jgi:hypothetical protein
MRASLPRRFPGAPLGRDEEGEALVEGEGGHVSLRLLLGPGRRHHGELEGVESSEPHVTPPKAAVADPD